MAPKRKATDAGLSSSPLKKRNAVTAGIGRAAESESNGIAFGYYTRTDDREDVSRTLLPPVCSSCPIFVAHTYILLYLLLLISLHNSICSDC